MFDAQLNRLQKLRTDVQRERSKSSPSGGGGKSVGAPGGRYGRSPSYEGWAVKGTRPASDRGVTFHFKHSFVSKRNSASKGYRDQTSAPAHQLYIERAGAAETGGDEERDISFGTLGANKAERTEFWRKVERAEGKAARVQCRIIVELPCEVDARGRERIARAFCGELEDRGFPYWCVLHAPDAKNDSRNYHAHIAYYDRPAAKTDEGAWDFEVVREKKYPNGARREVRPLKQNKLRDAQGPQWVRRLRRLFADAANHELAEAGAEKRYDARSYKDSGIPKTPTLHLGTQAAHAESQGLDTTRGKVNARRETAYRIDGGTRRYVADAAYADHVIDRLRRIRAIDPAAKKIKSEALAAARNYRGLSGDAAQAAKRKAVHDLAAEAVARRLDIRSSFLQRTSRRLVTRPPGGNDEAALDVADRLFDELLLVEEARHDVAPFVDGCRRISQAQGKRLAEIERRRGKELVRTKTLERDLTIAVLSAHQEGGKEFARDRQEALDMTFAASAPRAAEEPSSQAEPAPASEADAAERPPADEAPAFTRAVDSAYRRPGASDGAAAPSREAEDDLDQDAGQDLASVFSAWRDAGAPSAEGRSGNAADRAATDPEPSGPEGVEKPPRKTGRRRRRREISGAFSLPPEAGPEDVRSLNESVAAFTNAELRFVALATRDAADLSEDPARAKSHESAFGALRDVARRRGLDLDSGRHDPERATDPDLARAHLDSASTPIPPRGLAREKN